MSSTCEAQQQIAAAIQQAALPLLKPGSLTPQKLAEIISQLTTYCERLAALAR